MPQHVGDPNETFIQYDLYTMPFNDGKDGVATPLKGASKNGMSNSFPRYSPDGRWIVFVQSERGQLMRPDSKLYIVSARGGTPRKMDWNLPHQPAHRYSSGVPAISTTEVKRYNCQCPEM